MANIWSKLMAGVKAFREAFMVSNVLSQDAYGDFEARKIRYAVYWSYYEGSAYRDVHAWAKLLRVNYGLYQYVRDIYNPAYRLGEFWKSHLWGGPLDPDAGDGVSVPSALPIVTDNEGLRRAISQLWQWSNWQIKKDLVTLYGPVMGDVAIKIVDDTERRKVYLSPINPAWIRDVELDPFGNVKGYTLERQVEDPDNHTRVAIYSEVATRDGDNVVFETLKDGKPFAWDGEASSWSEPYGFVPMVFIKHNDTGFGWGWSELHPAHAKFREVDDIASKLSDQIRKMVDAPWFFSGVRKSDGSVSTSNEEPSTGRPQPGRESLPAIYAAAGSDAKPLVAPLDIAATSEYIKELNKILERDYPELTVDYHGMTGGSGVSNLSGRALRINRQAAEDKVLQRRAIYDDALVRAQQMAVAIGGFRGYVNFDGFSLESYSQGKLDHRIGERDVFKKDPLDDLEIDEAFWKTANEAKAAGVPLLVYLKRQGWSDEDISQIASSPEYEARQAAMQMATALGNTGDMPPRGQEGRNNGQPTEMP